jgi:ribosomal protein S27AE
MQGRRLAKEVFRRRFMEGPEMVDKGAPAETGAAPKTKRKMKKHCPVCGKRLYQDSRERWYCARCQAEVDGERVSFNYIPEDEFDTQFQTG